MVTVIFRVYCAFFSSDFEPKLGVRNIHGSRRTCLFPHLLNDCVLHLRRYFTNSSKRLDFLTSKPRSTYVEIEKHSCMDQFCSILISQT